VKLEKGKLVPVAALENDLAVDDLKEATSSQTPARSATQSDARYRAIVKACVAPSVAPTRFHRVRPNGAEHRAGRQGEYRARQENHGCQCVARSITTNVPATANLDASRRLLNRPQPCFWQMSAKLTAVAGKMIRTTPVFRICDRQVAGPAPAS
jgi:hypothetical protein